MLGAWPMLTANIDLTGQPIVHMLNIYVPHENLLPLCPPSFNVTPTLPIACHW